MSEQIGASSELIEISKLNGSYKRNYGTLIGAYLYLRTVNAVRGQSIFWNGLLFAALSGLAALLDKHGWLPRLSP